MATELLHGMYDGGHGAGLEDYWRSYESTPLFAGGFLWVFADEAVLRTDKPGKVFDSDGNNAPDGILGPHREKEGSFYTIKEIWSPVQVGPVIINKKWNGKLFLENKFTYTNLKECSFKWKAVKTKIGSTEETVVGNGKVSSPMAKPGETVQVQIMLNNSLKEADIFQFTAMDHHGKELYTWSWPVVQPDDKAAEFQLSGLQEAEIKIETGEKQIIAKVKDLEITFSKVDGTILNIKNNKGKISFSGDPVPVGIDSKVENVQLGKIKMVTIRSRFCTASSQKS